MSSKGVGDVCKNAICWTHPSAHPGVGVVLAAEVPFYRGESGSLGTGWFFIAIVVGALIGHPWALALAPVPFLVGANLRQWVQGPVPSGYGLFPGYEYSLRVVIFAIMGTIGILIDILLHQRVLRCPHSTLLSRGARPQRW